MMDTSEQYIEMCEQAVEIQEYIKYDFPDFGLWYGSFVFNKATETTFIASSKPHSEYIDDIIWLPRQDDLQAMVEKDCFELLRCFYSFIFSGSIEFLTLYADNFNSMEQLWLAFVMKKKYLKQWSEDKKEWIKI